MVVISVSVCCVYCVISSFRDFACEILSKPVTVIVCGIILFAFHVGKSFWCGHGHIVVVCGDCLCECVCLF